MIAPPPLQEISRLRSIVAKQSPELLPTLLYLLATVRQLSELTLHKALEFSGDLFTLTDYRRLSVVGTMPEDLRDLVFVRLQQAAGTSERRRLLQVLSVIDRLLQHEARSKIERLLKRDGEAAADLGI